MASTAFRSHGSLGPVVVIGMLSLALAVLLLAQAGLVPRPGSAAPQGLAASGGPSAALAAAQGSPRTGIVITRDGVARGQPDMAILTLGVETSGLTGREALDRNTAIMDAVAARLKAQGVPDDALRTAGLSLYPVREKEGDTSRYEAVQLLVVTVRDLSRIGELLDGATAAGANMVMSLRLALRDETALRQQALEDAVARAKAEAEQLAMATGLRITGIAAVETGESWEPLPDGAGAGSGPGVSIEPGSSAVAVRVTVTFSTE